jgi:hypothetical protein
LSESDKPDALIAGTREPGGPSPEGARVPPQLRPTLVAAFNSGWKMKDISGGFYADGRTAVPLQDGAASLVIDTAGRVTVGQWGRDAVMSPQVAAVRQNLSLVVDQGRPVLGLTANSSGAWGARRTSSSTPGAPGSGQTGPATSSTSAATS